ncbi:MAG: ParB/RepB/Spo0J family partition protein [Planctomycetes bacterium]|nr:ParB/RepB/Spo0J family partition protein [Planctomycetota bacterium]
MSKSTKRLGRGLDSLVSHIADATRNVVPDTPVAAPISKRSEASSVLQVDRGALMATIDSLQPNPFQPRDNTRVDTVVSLAKSIERNGILQPINVRPLGDRYQIIAGERRWRAALSLGLSHVPVIVRDASDEQMLELALIENIQREDLNAIDRARAYRRYCNTFGLRVEDVAERVGEDRSTVANYVRLLELPDEVQEMVAKGDIAMGHARCLLGIADSGRRIQLANAVVGNRLSVRALEELVRRERTRGSGEADTQGTTVRTVSPHLADMQRRFEETVRTKVVIKEGKRKGTGRIVIEYHSLDEFDRLASMLGVPLE